MKEKQTIWDWIYPRKCGFCQAPISEDYTCKTCQKKLQYRYVFDTIFLPYAKRCFCAYEYDGMIRQQLLALKFHHKPYGYRALAERLLQLLMPYRKEFDLLLAVPISLKRQWERGYNQSALLAEWLAKQMQISYQQQVLKKRKQNKTQSSLNWQERRQNVKGVFAVAKPKTVQGKRVLLVDDILTTGATAEECCRLLLQAGAKEITVAVIARAKIHHHRE